MNNENYCSEGLKEFAWSWTQDNENGDGGAQWDAEKQPDTGDQSKSWSLDVEKSRFDKGSRRVKLVWKRQADTGFFDSYPGAQFKAAASVDSIT